jgi:3' terminal RNA ribose 2'-O-methyltransferase Hen1
MPLDLTIRIPALPLAGDPDRVQSLFEPLGYEVEIVRPPLDPEFPSWGYARHGDVTLATRSPLALVLRHLFVLIPSLDSNKHYWIGSDEIEKLLAKGEGWLSDHPQREWITTRYLKFRRSLVSEALERLAPESDDEADDEEDIDEKSVPEAERALSLHEQRLDRVTELVKSINPETLVDLGCGGGKLLLRLLRKTKVPDILGVDVDSRSLEIASKRLRLETLPEKQRARVKLAQSALTYRDPRIEGRDVATLVEVIEHLEPDRLDSLERILFEHARPGTLIVTTPNREYNALFETLAEGKLRHPDHRFEWTRAEFQGWAERVSSENGYSFTIEPLGDEDETHGAPSQIAVFTRNPEQKP